MSAENPTGLKGIEFIEFSSKQSDWLHKLFKQFGFSRAAVNPALSADLYVQNDIKLILNDSKQSFSRSFERQHGPCVSSMGWRFEDAQSAFEAAVARGARPADCGDYSDTAGKPLLAIYGIGDSLLYFLDEKTAGHQLDGIGFEGVDTPSSPGMGFTRIDHLTNNVPQGEMEKWSEFYKGVFGFTEIRYFDIRGAKTGLTSYALQSPDGSFCIPINEGTEEKSQINEYLKEYKGAGVQHIAFLTDDILDTLDQMGGKVETLDIDDEYYREVFDRVPNVTEDRERIRNHNVLIDGDDEGYLLQIFTRNVVGPIFIEIIQRKNHYSFGEGNFGALFRSIERDQERRGVL